MIPRVSSVCSLNDGCTYFTGDAPDFLRKNSAVPPELNGPVLPNAFMHAMSSKHSNTICPQRPCSVFPSNWKTPAKFPLLRISIAFLSSIGQDFNWSLLIPDWSRASCRTLRVLNPRTSIFSNPMPSALYLSIIAHPFFSSTEQYFVIGSAVTIIPAACIPVCLMWPSTSAAIISSGCLAMVFFPSDWVSKESWRQLLFFCSMIEFFKSATSHDGIFNDLLTSTIADLGLNTLTVPSLATQSDPYFFPRYLTNISRLVSSKSISISG